MDYCNQYVIVHFCQCVIIMDVVNIHIFSMVTNDHRCECMHDFTMVINDHYCEILFYPV